MEDATGNQIKTYAFVKTLTQLEGGEHSNVFHVLCVDSAELASYQHEYVPATKEEYDWQMSGGKVLLIDGDVVLTDKDLAIDNA